MRLTTASLIISASFALSGCGGARDGSAQKQASSASASASKEPAPAVITESPAALATATSSILSAGSSISLALSEVIDSERAQEGDLYPATVAVDVMGSDGKLAVPEGSHAIVVAASAKKNGSISTLSLGLWQLTINGKPYLLGRGTIGQGTVTIREDGVQGDGHRSVHLQRGQLVKFTLADALRLKP